MNRYLPPSSETRATENREFEYQSIVYVYPASAVNAGANIFRRFRLTVAVSPQPSWPGLALLSGAVRCVLCLTQSLAACRRCPLFAVRVVRCPLSVVGCRINPSNTRASICFRKFPKIISYLIFASCTMFAQLKILCCSGTHLIPLYVVRHTVNVYTTIYLTPAGLTSVQYTQFYICFMTLRLIMLVVDVDVVLWPLPPMNYGPS